MVSSSRSYASPMGHSSQATSSHYNNSGSSHRAQGTTATITPSHEGVYTSPTESEFSEVYDGPDSVRLWDEKKVIEWLHSIRCGQYEQLFRGKLGTLRRKGRIIETNFYQ